MLTPPNSQSRIPYGYRPWGFSPLSTVPFFSNRYAGGTRRRSMGNQTLTTTKRRKRIPRNSFNRKLMNAQPAKHQTGSTIATLLHDQIWSFTPTVAITQGDAYNSRTGDYVHLAAIKLKGFFNSAVTAGAYSYRILVGYTGEEYNITSLSTSGLADAEIFLPNTTSNFRPAGLVNPKAFTCLFDQTIDINSQIVSTLDLQSYAFTVQLDKKFPYQANASVFGKNQNLMVVVIGSIAGGTGGVTAAGGVTLAYDLIFKDI